MLAAEPRVLGECGGKSFVEEGIGRFLQQRRGPSAPCLTNQTGNNAFTFT